ncbi:hypothetical protein [Polaribacter porphyrae]|uniref:Uncharacterized protein n=1 Tax=Polaribacter porphyrae TaxID=1137780 RepID=A0A2S7WSE3_9FLAO|nr:hypothetical protein [Polaribacter porphyrae]PQJ80386.1 hypothetical protein BTO18_14910 [Polaribacter porphyrae]
MLKKITRIFDKQVLFWEKPNILKRISNFLVIAFIICSIISLLVYFNFIDVGRFNMLFIHPFFAIEVAFTIILILELLSLIFILPKSVSISLGKQFELLSLIFLRNAFKEFSHLDEFLVWEDSKTVIYKMITYSFGALFIFIVMGITQRLNRKIRLSETFVNQLQFVRIKKILALFLLLSFFLIGANDIYFLFKTGKYLHSFDTFYTVLIFTDIIIVLVALRYTINFYRVFRYSAYVLATILIRISLTMESYYDVFLGAITSVFILLLSLAYIHIQKGLTAKELKS